MTPQYSKQNSITKIIMNSYKTIKSLLCIQVPEDFIWI